MIFTGNVFLTTSRQVIDKVFLSNTVTPIKLLESALSNLTPEEFEKSLIATPNRNTNILEFDFSFNYSAKDAVTLTLKLLETNSPFELFYTNRNTTSEMVSRIIQDIETNRTEQIIPTTNFRPGTTQSAGRLIRPKTFNSNDRLELKQLLLENSTSEIGQKIYFAFGVGSDLTQWAGPYGMTLVASEFQVNEAGIREITLIFNGIDGGLLRNYIEAANDRSFQRAINKYNFILTDKVITGEEYEVVTKEVMESNFLSFCHYYTKNLIQNYIKKISGSNNCIALLPNLNEIATGEQTEQYKILLNPFVDNGSANPFNQIDFNRFKAIKGPKELYESTFGIPIEIETGLTSMELTLDGRTEFKENDRQYRLVLRTRTGETNDAAESLPDYYLPLKKFGEKISSIMYKYSNWMVYNQVLLVETNIKTLKLWKEQKFIANDKEPCYVFGSEQLISELLYLTDANTLEDALKLPFFGKMVEESDSKKFRNTDYRVKYFNTFKKNRYNSSFGEQLLKQDDLAYSEEAIKLIKTAGIPVFKHNTNNPNILALSIKDIPGYRAVYSLGFNLQSYLPFVNSSKINAEDLIKSSSLKNYFELRSEVEKDLEIYSNSVISPDINTLKMLVTGALQRFGGFYLNPILTENPEITREEFASILALDVYNRYRRRLPYVEVSNKSEATYIQKELIDQLNKLQFSLSIRTLPFFSLADTSIRKKKCVLQANQNSIIGLSEPAKPSYYSGIYNILGFRHVINANEMYSEFNILRDTLANGPESINVDVNTNELVRESVK